MPDLATSTTSGVTTGETFSVAGRFVSAADPGPRSASASTTSPARTTSPRATITLRGQRRDRFAEEVPLDGCAEGCALSSVTLGSDADASVEFDSLGTETIELVNGDWIRYEPAARSAT